MCPEGGSSRVLGSWLLREGLGVSLSWVRRTRENKNIGSWVLRWGVGVFGSWLLREGLWGPLELGPERLELGLQEGS